MVALPETWFRFLQFVSLIILLSLSLNSLAQAPIIHPGPPGSPSRDLTPERAIEIAKTSYSAVDVRFMQDMIPHHHQALEMAELVADRTNNPELVDVAGRINVSQMDEIEFMQQWLRERGERVPDPDDHDAMHTDHRMAGMATPEQMAELAAAEGTDFDRLFLQLMITHHEGAVTMVEELHELPGSAYDPVLFEFTNDINNGQEAEIERMSALLIGLSDDPRASLAAGFKNADYAIRNLEYIGSLPKPPGFFDPENPAGLPPEQPEDDEDEDEEAEQEAVAEQDVAGDKEDDEEDEGDEEEDEWDRNPLLSFTNSDMAFIDDVMITGSYHGYNIYRLMEERLPSLISSVVCPGGQGDVSVVGDLLIMSVEQTRARLDCGLEGVDEDISEDRFRGIRIFDISDTTRPRQVGAVQTCRGSHTHTVVAGPENDGRIIVYNSGTSRVRDEEELEGCIGDIPGDDRTALFRIDVIEIPVDDPSQSRIVHSPTVFADLELDTLAGLWRGGDHGDETQETRRTDQCHDITVFPDKKIAAGACSGNGILFDISDPFNPQRMDAVVDTGFAYWHSATFNHDGTKVIFTDEWGGGGRSRCRAYDPLTWGADAIYDIVNDKLEFRGYYKLPAPQVEEENCVAHNGSIIPVPGRDIFVQAWYQGGISVIDFTDSEYPMEIAYFDRGPVNADHLVSGGFWSAYWYNGRIYGTEMARGLDVFELAPSAYLSEHEIAAAVLADVGGVFNPQQQLAVNWPAEPVVARAYIDQLERGGHLQTVLMADLIQALDDADLRISSGERDVTLAARLESLAAGLSSDDSDNSSGNRMMSLIDILGDIAARLR
jgi:uncharacterized protein (DUF305 family)